MSACSPAAGLLRIEPPPSTRRRVVAMVGAPNSGKSTLFNRLTGLRQKVANYPGVTVEQRMGRARVGTGGEVFLIDLPGVYGLEPRSEDERITRDVLVGRMQGIPAPDAILLVLDATQLGRHLALAAPILGLGLPTLIVLNMADELRRRRGEIDTAALARQLGAPVALISAVAGDGIEAVSDYLSGTVGVPAPVELPVLHDVPQCREWARKMGGAAGYRSPAPSLATRRLDAWLLHPVVGPLFFLMVVVAVFQGVFAGARPLMDALQGLLAATGTWIGPLVPEGFLRSLVLDGILAGVGSVVVFLPQILLLFLFIGILEDTGYLARAALIADRTMARIGLQGKAFFPLLSAYACAVPAILATRTIENQRDRTATILVAPFMTCSARLPVYTLIIAAFLPDKPLLGPLLGLRAAAMIGLYALGFAAALATARLLKSSILKSDRTIFVLEMPPYRWPTLRGLALRLYDRAKVFLRRAGTVILAVSLGIWLLSSVPLKDGAVPQIQDSIAGTVGRTVEPLIRPLGFDWKIGIGLITSLAAREVIVGTLGTIYGLEGDARESGLQQALQHDLTLGGAVALLVFFAFAMQCTSTLAVVRRETGSWKWPLLQFAYMGTLAYVGAFLANRIVSFWG